MQTKKRFFNELKKEGGVPFNFSTQQKNRLQHADMFTVYRVESFSTQFQLFNLGGT